MSNDVLTRVWKQSPQKGSALLLTVAIADIVNNKGVGFPGDDYLKDRIRMSRRNTERLIGHLEDTGEIYRRIGQGRGNKTFYAVLTGFDKPAIENVLKEHNRYFDLDPDGTSLIAETILEKRRQFVQSKSEKKQKNSESRKVLKKATNITTKGDIVERKTPTTIEPLLINTNTEDSLQNASAFADNAVRIEPSESNDPTPNEAEGDSPTVNPIVEVKALEEKEKSSAQKEKEVCPNCLGAGCGQCVDEIYNRQQAVINKERAVRENSALWDTPVSEFSPIDLLSTRVVDVRSNEWQSTPPEQRVYIGRNTFEHKSEGWGNPFIIGDNGTRNDVITKYREYLLSKTDLLDRVRSLRDKTLGCWCKDDPREAKTKAQLGFVPCHGDVLAEIAALSDVELDKLITRAQHEPPLPTNGTNLVQTPPIKPVRADTNDGTKTETFKIGDRVGDLPRDYKVGDHVFWERAAAVVLAVSKSGKYKILIDGLIEQSNINLARLTGRLYDVQPLDAEADRRIEIECGKPTKTSEVKAWSALSKAMYEATPPDIREPKIHYAKHNDAAKTLYDAGFTAQQVGDYTEWAYEYDTWLCCGGADKAPVVIWMGRVEKEIKSKSSKVEAWLQAGKPKKGITQNGYDNGTQGVLGNTERLTDKARFNELSKQQQYNNPSRHDANPFKPRM